MKRVCTFNVCNQFRGRDDTSPLQMIPIVRDLWLWMWAITITSTHRLPGCCDCKSVNNVHRAHAHTPLLFRNNFCPSRANDSIRRINRIAYVLRRVSYTINQHKYLFRRTNTFDSIYSVCDISILYHLLILCSCSKLEGRFALNRFYLVKY